MRKLIINADDFGYNKEVTDGTIQCHRIGTVTSATLMANMPAAEYAAEEGKKYPNLSVGIHLTLTNGKPVSDPQKIPALLGPDGNFNNLRYMYRQANRFRLPSDQIEREFRAQIEKFFSFGITPSHCDSHHHISNCVQTFPIKLKLLEEYNIKRLRTQRGFYRIDKTCSQKFKILLKTLKVNAIKFPSRAYYELQHSYCRLKGHNLPDVRYGFSKLISSPPLKFDIAGWEKLIANMPCGITEIGMHPGLPSDDPLDWPAFREQRVVEYNLLINPECKKICEEHDVELISFNEI